MNKKMVLLFLVSFSLLLALLSSLFIAFVEAVPEGIGVEEKYSTAQEATDAASSGSIEVDQTVARSFQGNLTGTIQGGHQMLQSSSFSNSASFTRHLMCKDYDSNWNPVDPTTIFRPSDTKAGCLMTVSLDNKIESKWYYRSDSSKSWDFYNKTTSTVDSPGTYYVWHSINISGCLPGFNYPRAWKLDVYIDDSKFFSEFFEVTNGGLNSPRMCEDIDVNGDPVNIKSWFTIGVDTKAHHYLCFDEVAYFNEELKCCARARA